MMFTDPRYFIWLFQHENEFRTKIPFIYYNIWDDTLFYPTYNKAYYESCDALLGISRQTTAMNKVVLDSKTSGKVIKYIPHGVNTKFFFPIDKDYIKYNEYQQFKNQLLSNKQYDFVLLWNSRNIQRKHPADLMVAWKLFCDKIGVEKSKKCALVLHTQPIDDFGTDLVAVKEMLFDYNQNENYNIIFSDQRMGVEGMNYLYNLSDANILVTSNEGYGISLNEARLCGKMIIAPVQGGMVDQMRFENDKGEWLDFEKGFLSNSFGTYKNHGDWAIPIYPSNISLAGSVPTPYIADPRVDFRDIAKAIEEVYNLSPEERSERGLKGREWTLSSESKMTSEAMCENIIEAIDETFKTFKPRKAFSFDKIETKEHSEHFNDFKLEKYKI